jgi:glycosyltransferase involved in cell wall biosynthesis
MTAVAELMSRFPKASETFILNEALELRRLGLRVELFPLLEERGPAVQPESAELARTARYPRREPRAVLAAQVHWLRARPRAYLSAWAEALYGNRTSPKFLARTLAVVPAAAWFAREMERIGISHVHAHYATHPALAAWVCHRLTGLPYSFTAHAHDLYVERPMLAAKARDAAFVVAISEFNRRMLEELLDPRDAGRVHVVRCGVDIERFTPRPREPHAGLRIACVASLEPYKGHVHLVDALAQLAHDGVAFECNLVGGGELRAALEARVQALGLGGSVRFLGPQPSERVAALVGAADVVVLPSIITAEGKMEGLPVALMEALAVETPVIASAISGIPELVEDGVTGLLVPPGDPQALAAALARLAADPEQRSRLGRQGREQVRAQHDIHANVAALAALIERDSVPAPVRS